MASAIWFSSIFSLLSISAIVRETFNILEYALAEKESLSKENLSIFLAPSVITQNLSKALISIFALNEKGRFLNLSF